jgi:hypothetical protein
MNRSGTEGKSASEVAISNTENTRLTGPWLIVARVVWLALVVPSLGLCVVSLLASYQQLQRACDNPVICNNLAGALTAKELQELSIIGISASGYATLLTIFYVLLAAIWCAVGFLVFWRRSDDWLALLAAFFLAMYIVTSLSSNNAPFALALSYPVFSLPIGYDIDLLINRTLVYGSLTALLALLYFGLIFVLQTLFQEVFHQNNAVAIVISTLVIAALFQPLRHQIQRFIDRRFYRSKYDAAKTLEAFSATLRNEVDLSQLREQLLNVVQETMQPTQSRSGYAQLHLPENRRRA